jgi:hypothetical protein
MFGHFSAKCLADLVNESLSLSEEDAIAASSSTESPFQRLSSPAKDAAAFTTTTTSTTELPPPPASSQLVKRTRIPGVDVIKLFFFVAKDKIS